VAPHFKNLQRSIQYFQGLSLHPPLITVEDQFRAKNVRPRFIVVKMFFIDDSELAWREDFISIKYHLIRLYVKMPNGDSMIFQSVEQFFEVWACQHVRT